MAGDKIIEVNGKSAKGKTTEELSKILKGQPNTEVSILIERKGQEPFVVNFKREKVTVKSVPYYGFLENGIAYIKLRSFTRDCSNDIKNALTDLKTQQELKGIILDLRSNPGGLLNESIDIVNLFVEKGENIVITKGKIKDWEKTYKARYFPEDKETPLIILINQNSASASEIVSGAIQDLDRGVVVGKRSYGKGLVQQTRKLSYNSQLKVTVAKYYIPSGRCIQALDYSNRNKDGSVGKIPDSLISTFKTRNGREVKDGGGIIPDVKVKQDVISDITISIIRERLIFDYATDFRLENDSIISADNFEITDNEFEKFTSYLKDKEYKYTTATEDALEIFKEIAEEEKSFYEIEEQYNLLSSQIKNNKENDLSKNKEELKEFLSDEIVSRYFYQEGRIINRLKYDKEVKEAINILHDLNRYNEILNKTDE